MQNTSSSSNLYVNAHKRTVSHITPHLKAVSHSYLTDIALSGNHFLKSSDYVSSIEDPLWKRVCQDIVTLMGPASALKLWKTKLGQLSAQDKILNIICENEETATFVQQYDFVILGSIQQYFPALETLKAKTLSSLSYE